MILRQTSCSLYFLAFVACVLWAGHRRWRFFGWMNKDSVIMGICNWDVCTYICMQIYSHLSKNKVIKSGEQLIIALVCLLNVRVGEVLLCHGCMYACMCVCVCACVYVCKYMSILDSLSGVMCTWDIRSFPAVVGMYVYVYS
jgi:hypothetical protein